MAWLRGLRSALGLDCWRTEVWLIDPAAWDHVTAFWGFDDPTHPPLQTKTHRGVLTIPILGPLGKQRTSVVQTAYPELQAAVEAAAADPGVKAIVLSVDSPGGSSSGIDIVGDKIKAAAAVKPVTAVVHGAATSGAYWLASQAREIVAHPGAVVGSIGAGMVLYDKTKAMEKYGVEPKPFMSGKLKLTGAPGVEWTKERTEEVQGIVDKTAARFYAVVQAGRKLSDAQMAPLKDAGIYFDREAVSAGLVDRIATQDEVMAQLSAGNGSAARVESSDLPEPEMSAPAAAANAAQSGGAAPSAPATQGAATAAPATFKQLKAAIPKASTEFIAKCAEDELTLEAATARFMADPVAAMPAAEVPKQPSRPMQGHVQTRRTEQSSEASTEGDPVQAFSTAVAREMSEAKAAGLEIERMTAVANVADKHPSLYDAFMEATSAPLPAPSKGRTAANARQ